MPRKSLRPSKERLELILLRALNMKEAAIMAGCSYPTIFKWKQQLSILSPEQRARKKFADKHGVMYERY